jgi:inositol phosphorylceramide synthase catalytic subunit
MFAKGMIPQKLRRKWRATKARIRGASPTTTVTKLESSLSPSDTIRALRKHHWSVYDGQYILLAMLAIFCLSIMTFPSPLFRTFIASLLITSLLIPLTRQFFLPFLPIIGYLVLFYSCKYVVELIATGHFIDEIHRFIPSTIRPEPWVRVLPALENIFYGANLSNILAAHKHTILDVLAWFPYGICHFGAPAVVSALIFIFGPPGSTPIFAKTFGWMNIIGVFIQLIFPCSPPWYENMYGFAPANYNIAGSPAGLAAIDKLFGVDLYTSTFTASPQVFGAFPSMHSANATLEALFMAHLLPHLSPLFFAYALWLWWATMYLSHHYAIDLVAGSLRKFCIAPFSQCAILIGRPVASIFFFISRAKFIPRIQPGKTLRWDYDFVEVGEVDMSYVELNSVEDYMPARSDDEWTIGESSSIHSDARERSPSVASGETDVLWSKESRP